MTEISFGTLTEASLREAWPHEAHSFTPWLAANLDRIAAAIGMPLELVDTEVAVTSFSADILAKSVETGSFVLIENQLEEGDHLHLGQILTYLAGLKAETVVWVASKFRDAHLSAIRWLNEHTVEPYAFFAVKVRVVRIGLSPYAPLFDVIEGPSNWDRQVQEVARETQGTTDLGKFRRAFWTHYLNRHGAGPTERGGGAGSSRWRRLSDGSTMVIQYVAKESVGVFVRSETSGGREALLARLQPYAAELEIRLGGAFASGSDGYMFVSKVTGDTSDPANWDRMSDWLKAEADRYALVVDEVLSRPPPAASEPA